MVVGVLPPAQDTLGIWADGSVGGRDVIRPVPGQARSAFVLWNPESPDLPLSQTLWTGGGVFSGVGKEVPSVDVNAILGFVDPVTDLVGVGFGDDLAVRTTDQARVDELLVGVLRSSTPVAANSVFTVVVVPPGGTIVGVGGAEGLRVSPVRPLAVASPFEDIGPERLAVTVRLDSDEPVDGPGIDSVRWTDADGTTHDTSFADVR